MAFITYVGDHAAVYVPVNASQVIEAEKGVAVEVPSDLAKNLTASAAWLPADKPADKAAGTKPAAKQAEPEVAEPEAEEAS